MISSLFFKIKIFYWVSTTMSTPCLHSQQLHTVLSAGFSIFVYWKVAVNIECTIYVHEPDFYFRPYILRSIHILYFILPTNGPDISGGDFFTP